MFPNYLDGAKVLEYTEKEDYGDLTDYDENDIPIEKEISYFAICRYETGGYYLFSCDCQYEVLNDSYFDTIEQCKSCRKLPPNTAWYKK